MGDDKIGIVCILLFFIGMIAGAFASSNYWERQAVKHGAAEYILDPATGKTTWQWKKGEKL